MNEDISICHENAALPDAAMITDERKQILRRALAQLTPQFRETLVLREVEGLSYQDIADMIQVPIGTVMSRLSRAREQLALLVSQDPAGNELRLQGVQI